MAVDQLKLADSTVVSAKRALRLAAVVVLALVLLIPLAMVRSVVEERHHRYRGVVDEIAGAWSGPQWLTGPLLVVPFTEHYTVTEEVRTEGGGKRTIERAAERAGRVVILPDELAITGELRPETRRRGMFAVTVYTNDLALSGSFRDLGQRVVGQTTPGRRTVIAWDQAVLGVGLTEPRGIAAVSDLTALGQTLDLQPGSGLPGLIERGFHAPLAAGFDGQDMTFSMTLSVRGSGEFRFRPVGGRTTAKVSSTWSSPSFSGELLPTAHTVTAAGFTARWDVPLLSRSYPQQWLEGTAVGLDEATAGVRLFEPVALYDKVTRAVKYGLLFVVLTFLTLGLIELATGEAPTVLQYLLIGVALALFFLILIALAEHLSFLVAYLVAATVVVALTTLYCRAALAQPRLAAVVGLVLTLTYGVLYLILVAEDFALLGGTALLVVALAVTMYLTRGHRRQAAP